MEIPFAYEITILETLTGKRNFGIFEECRGAGRKNVEVQEEIALMFYIHIGLLPFDP